MKNIITEEERNRISKLYESDSNDHSIEVNEASPRAMDAFVKDLWNISKVGDDAAKARLFKSHFGFTDDLAEKIMSGARGADMMAKDLTKLMRSDLKAGKDIFMSDGRLANAASKTISKGITVQKIYEDLQRLGQTKQGGIAAITEKEVNGIVTTRIKEQKNALVAQEQTLRKSINPNQQGQGQGQVQGQGQGQVQGQGQGQLKLPKILNIFKLKASSLGVKWVLGLGLVGGAAWLLLRQKNPNLTDKEIASAKIPSCLLNLLDDEGCRIESTAAKVEKVQTPESIDVLCKAVLYNQAE